MERLGLTEHSRPKGRLDLGDKAAFVALCHRDGRLWGQSYFGEQGEDLRGGGMPYPQSLKMKTTLRQGGSRMDAR